MVNDNKAYLQRLKEKQAKIKARIQAVEAREKVQERKKETRRKILIGAYYWEQAQKNNTLDELKQQMADFLTRDSDRRLFDLPLKASE